ncbi:MAG: class I SAM-dependent methyltransferase [Candidatus Caldarchaeum sp.]|nr:class I SAM-dependent methyltransferase [Candidatus Caldarchaeum sp.]MDW8359643.1 class I SAM-dependent methyltransferase [Candidatus Caldarchaeum sp.]
MDEGPGLGWLWPEVIGSIQSLAPVYDKVNRVISFASDRRLRAEALRDAVGVDDLVLDAGAGNGVFTQVLLETQPKVRDVVLLDAIPEMLAKACLNPGIVNPVVGDFEKTPFRDGVFDSVLMGFSLRDARNMNNALSEVKRVMADGGKLVVVDLGKPNNPLKKLALAAYWKALAPLLAFVAVGRVGLRVHAIYKTYRRLPKNSQLKSMLEKFFTAVEVKEKMLGGALIAFARLSAGK